MCCLVYLWSLIRVVGAQRFHSLMVLCNSRLGSQFSFELNHVSIRMLAFTAGTNRGVLPGFSRHGEETDSTFPGPICPKPEAEAGVLLLTQAVLALWLIGTSLSLELSGSHLPRSLFH